MKYNYNLGLPSARIKTANTLKFDKLPNILSSNISGYMVSVTQSKLLSKYICMYIEGNTKSILPNRDAYLISVRVDIIVH